MFFPLALACLCDKWSPYCNKAGFCSNIPSHGLLINGCNNSAGSCLEFNCKSQKPFTVSQIDKWKDEEFVDEYNNTFFRDGNLVLSMKYNDLEQMGKIVRVSSIRQYHYGRYEATIKTSGGKGIVNSFIYKTHPDKDVGDEIDFEWIQNEAQTNFFVGGVVDYTNGMKHGNRTGFHKYAFDFQPQKISWYLDDVLIREQQTNASEKGFIFFSMWDTCKSQPGTQTWAQGPSNFCNRKTDETLEMEVSSFTAKCKHEASSASRLFIKLFF